MSFRAKIVREKEVGDIHDLLSFTIVLFIPTCFVYEDIIIYHGF